MTKHKITWLVIVLFSFVSIFLTQCSKNTQVEADLALLNGKIWTVDPQQPASGLVTRIIPLYTKTQIRQAIKGYSIISAYSAIQEQSKGAIEPGKLGDMIILSQDILTIAPEKIENTEVLYTIIKGQMVYEKKQNKSNSMPVE